MDRRAFRTRGLLQHAHMALILEKGYEATTVKDICDAAKVGRSTFYAHYASKADLRRGCFAGLRRQLAERQRQAGTAQGNGCALPLAFSLPLFEHARDHVHMYRALVGGRGGVISLGEIRNIVADLVRTEFRRGKGTPDPVARDVAIAYVGGAFMAVLTWWLDGGAKLSPQRIDAMFRRLALGGVTA